MIYFETQNNLVQKRGIKYMEHLIKLNELFHSKELGIALLNTSDLSNFFYKMNDTLKQFLQYDEEGINLLNLTDISHSEDMAKTLENANKILNGELSCYTYQKRYIRKDKSVFWGLTSVTRISGKFLLFIIKDITALKELELSVQNIVEPFNDDHVNEYCHRIKKEVIPYNDERHRRQYFRVKILKPICATLVLEQVINGVKTEFSPGKVCLRDIGPGGLRFHTNLNLPTHEVFSLSFTFTLLGNKMQLNGDVVRSRKLHKIHEYGICFRITEPQRDNLTRILNNLSILYHNHVKIYDTDICEDACDFNK